MKVLRNVTPTPEQLKVIQDVKPGSLVVRGAAGSGKTTTGLIRLRQLVAFWASRVRDGHAEGPIRVLILTFNRTLRGYIEALATEQGRQEPDVAVEISTFGSWSRTLLDRPDIAGARSQTAIWNLGHKLGFDRNFLVDEVEYLLGRFLPEDLDQYVTVERSGRGASPRMPRNKRRDLLDSVVAPYANWKKGLGVVDWNDMAVSLARSRHTAPYHVIIVDEAQDFSANQVRALLKHLYVEHTVTFIIDSTQQIYPRHFLWREVQLTIGRSQVHNLRRNYRNTKQIAAFALPLVDGLVIPDDGTLPDFEACSRDGDLPRVVEGRFGRQMDLIVEDLETIAEDSPDDSSVILHALGGGWFGEVRSRLESAAIHYVELTREGNWPSGSENVALSTMHSAKGLEFDHVFIVGLNAEVTPHGIEPGDTFHENYRRLLAMAIGRARKTVTVGYKPGEASTLVDHLVPGTYEPLSL